MGVVGGMEGLAATAGDDDEGSVIVCEKTAVEQHVSVVSATPT
jgi:hypothetical protein